MEITNREIANRIKSMGQLLEIKGEDTFKIRAYYRAAEAIRRLDKPAASLSEAELIALPHIGKNIARKIVEYTETGRIGELETLLETIPEGLPDLLRLNGVGPKTVHLLWLRLGIEDIDTLEAAARGRRIRSLRGFGERKEKEIIQSIREFRRQRGRMTRVEADAVIKALGDILGEDTFVVAGSYRRGKSTIGDIDVVTKDPPRIVNGRLREKADEIIDEGERKTSIRLKDRRVDIRFARPENFGSMLMYLTGSKDFNVHLRSIAIERGWRLNEYGILDTGNDRLYEFGTEEEMFAHLKMGRVPPELREDTGEIELAQRGALPVLVDLADIRGDLHVHSTWSDGNLTLDELALIGEQRGYEYLLCSDHSASLGVARGMNEETIRRQQHEIELLNRHAGCRILAGIEVDILTDGSLGMPAKVLGDCDLVIASIHSGFRQDRDTMTRRLLTAVAHDHVDIIGHPTGRLLGRRPAYDVDIDRLIMAAGDAKTALEINASPFRLDLDDIYVRRAKENGVMLAIGTDAHSREEFDNIGLGVTIACRGWCDPAHVLNTLSLDELLGWTA